MVTSCDKWKDPEEKDLGLKNYYCNIPEAMNYNHGFPGTPNDSVCIFPIEPFIGSYLYTDSIFNSNNELIQWVPTNFYISNVSRSQFALHQFCGNANTLQFRADKYYRATSDSLLEANTPTQLMCNNIDTLTNANLEFFPKDSTLSIALTVVTDSGIFYHKGKAKKQ
jgi:hypothetical protein